MKASFENFLLLFPYLGTQAMSHYLQIMYIIQYVIFTKLNSNLSVMVNPPRDITSCSVLHFCNHFIKYMQIKQKLSKILQLNFCYLKIIRFFSPRYDPNIAHFTEIHCRFSYSGTWQLVNQLVGTKMFSYHIRYENIAKYSRV